MEIKYFDLAIILKSMPNKYNYYHSYYYVNISLRLLFLLLLFSVNARTVCIYPCVHIEKKKDKSTDTFLICFYCWENRFNCSLLCSSTVNYGLACLYSWSPLWVDNDTLSCNQRYRWTKRHFPLCVHQQLSLHALCLLMNWNLRTKMVLANFQKATDNSSSQVRSMHQIWWVSPCSLWC